MRAVSCDLSVAIDSHRKGDAKNSLSDGGEWGQSPKAISYMIQYSTDRTANRHIHVLHLTPVALLVILPKAHNGFVLLIGGGWSCQSSFEDLLKLKHDRH